MAKKEEASLESVYIDMMGVKDVNKLIENIYAMMGEENYKNVGEYYTDLHNDHSLEMARVGYIENPSYAIDVYSRELQHEQPHISVIQISKTSDSPVAKIALPKINEFNDNPDIELIVLWQKTPNTVNSRIKKTVRTWFKKKHKSGLTNLQFAWELWDAQAEQYKGHVSGRQGAKKNISKKK